jgi:DNA-directed RNA polymerase subunit RPC12/RpoP
MPTHVHKKRTVKKPKVGSTQPIRRTVQQVHFSADTGMWTITLSCGHQMEMYKKGPQQGARVRCSTCEKERSIPEQEREVVRTRTDNRNEVVATLSCGHLVGLGGVDSTLSRQKHIACAACRHLMLTGDVVGLEDAWKRVRKYRKEMEMKLELDFEGLDTVAPKRMVVGLNTGQHGQQQVVLSCGHTLNLGQEQPGCWVIGETLIACNNCMLDFDLPEHVKEARETAVNLLEGPYRAQAANNRAVDLDEEREREEAAVEEITAPKKKRSSALLQRLQYHLKMKRRQDRRLRRELRAYKAALRILLADGDKGNGL